MKKTIRFASTITQKGIKASCGEGIRHRLRFHWGMMRDWYHWDEEVAIMVTAYDRNKPIGKAILLDKSDSGVNVGIYIRPQYRRQGIGKKLMQILKKRNSANQRIFIKAKWDDQAGKQFYQSVGVASWIKVSDILKGQR